MQVGEKRFQPARLSQVNPGIDGRQLRFRDARRLLMRSSAQYGLNGAKALAHVPPPFFDDRGGELGAGKRKGCLSDARRQLREVR
jgi:hypothetical protein